MSIQCLKEKSKKKGSIVATSDVRNVRLQLPPQMLSLGFGPSGQAGEVGTSQANEALAAI
jgi:hypothetical protein